MTLEDLDELVRELLTKIRELKLDLLLGNNKLEEDLHKALELTDEIYAMLYTIKLKLQKQKTLKS